MRGAWVELGAAGLVLLAMAPTTARVQPDGTQASTNFFEKSLHFTNRGIEFVYSKEHGGLERLTGLTASQVGCVQARCHVQSCDTCHRKDVAGRPTYSLDTAVAQAACEACHGVPEGPDVHREKGMRCMDCHTAREVHGDGVAHDSYMRPGVLETTCERCHSDIPRSPSHTVHAGKLDCSACHVGEVTTCLNCHVETRVKDGKSRSLPLKGLLFLVNHDGRVTVANLLSYVYRSRTMITLAPTFPHSIRRTGRACGECHGTRIVAEIVAGTFTPAWWEHGQVRNATGVVPVLEGMKWNVPFLNLEGGTWVPIADPPEPLLNYSGSCAPLTREQFVSLQTQPGNRGGPR